MSEAASDEPALENCSEPTMSSSAGGTVDESGDSSGRRSKQYAAAARFSDWAARYPLLVVAIAFVGSGQLFGLLRVRFNIDVPPLGFGVAAATSLVAYLIIARSVSRRPGGEHSIGRLVPHPAALFLFVGFFVSVGGYRQASSQRLDSDDLGAWATREPKSIAVRCEILSAAIWKPNPSHRPTDPSSEPWMTTWDVQCYQVQQSGVWTKIEALTSLATKGKESGWLPGDRIECYGSFRAIYPATNPGAFDLAEHSAARNRFVMLSVEDAAQIERLDRSWSRPVSRVRALAVEYCDHLLHRFVTNGKAPLAAALVFGQRQQVDWSEQQELMATGTLHMLAISGMHVEIVASGVLGLCFVFGIGARSRFALIACVCVAYALLADGKPPVLRATVLVLAFELARLAGRRARMTNMLSLAAVFLYALQVQNASNVGVHLSFLAVAAIGVFVVGKDGQEVSAFRKLQLGAMGRMPRFLQVSASYVLGMLRLSFWVWVTTCPLVWYHFHVVAPVAIPLNVFISVPLALSLLMGLLTVLLGVLPVCASATGTFCGGALTLISNAIDFCERLPGGHVWLPSPPLWWIVSFYAVLCVWLLVFREKRRRWLAGVLSVLIGAAIALHIGGERGLHWRVASSTDDGPASVSTDSSGTFAATFLDVGHGTSVVLELPDGRVWLYDAGHLGASDRSHQEIAEALWDLKTTRIDTLILSHADSDHYNAVEGLAERFQIGRVWTTSSFKSSPDRPVQELLERLDQLGIPIQIRAAGDQGYTAGVEWKVLHPDRDTFESDNASSLCLQMEYRGKRVLLPGDLEGMGMFRLLELPNRPCHALMAPHHGSLTKDPTEILQWCRPELVVISGNHRAVRPAVVARFAAQTQDLGITFRDGAIRWSVHPDGHTTSSRWNVDHWESLQQNGQD